MYTYMEYLQRCFYKSTNWNEDNIYSNILATSQALLDFSIPNGCKLDISSKSTDHLASSFTLSNYHNINGSLAYLYSSIPLRNTAGTRDISLQEAISGLRITEPYRRREKSKHHNGEANSRCSLLYGRMYFPGSALEAMLIKRLSEQTQILVKCINHPQVDKNGTLIFYWQKNAPNFLREFIYSTNEALFGFRMLYNLSSLPTNSYKLNTNLNSVPKFDNSVVSVGSEIWYAALSTSPGLSTALRYSTRSTSTGKPFTMTLACNPIVGHISSTYTVRTSVASSFCSKYNFNVYSYASNLYLGFELFNSSKDSQISNETEYPILQSSRFGSFPSFRGHQGDLAGFQEIEPSYKNDPKLLGFTDEYLRYMNSQRRPHGIRMYPSRESVTNESIMRAFNKMVNESDFTSVLKVSTSLNEKMLKFLWEGRCKDFLLSAGVKLNLNCITNYPEIGRFGVSLSYAL